MLDERTCTSEPFSLSTRLSSSAILSHAESFGVAQLIIRGQAARFNEIYCARAFVNLRQAVVTPFSGCTISPFSVSEFPFLFFSRAKLRIDFSLRIAKLLASISVIKLSSSNEEQIIFINKTKCRKELFQFLC